MSKVTVEQFLNAGFEFVDGDKFDDSYLKGDVVTVGNIVAACEANRASNIDSEINVISLALRPNTGTQPVGDDCVVEATRKDGVILVRRASEIGWDLLSSSLAIKSWKPSLKHSEQQMNDQQESALELTERDIEDAFDNSEVVTLNFRPEVAARDKLIDLGYEYVNGEWLTPEQIAAIDREKELHEIAEFMKQDKSASDCEGIYNYITHKRYRK